MLDLLAIHKATLPARLGVVLLKAEDYHSFVAEVEWLRKLACENCSADVPLQPDGYHKCTVTGELQWCDGNSEEEGD